MPGSDLPEYPTLLDVYVKLERISGQLDSIAQRAEALEKDIGVLYKRTSNILERLSIAESRIVSAENEANNSWSHSTGIITMFISVAAVLVAMFGPPIVG